MLLGVFTDRVHDELVVGDGLSRLKQDVGLEPLEESLFLIKQANDRRFRTDTRRLSFLDSFPSPTFSLPGVVFLLGVLRFGGVRPTTGVCINRGILRLNSAINIRGFRRCQGVFQALLVPYEEFDRL